MGEQERSEETGAKEVSIRILQLKNNFCWNSAETGRGALGEYCVLGYFDALDISKADKAEAKEFDTWERLGELTSKQDNTLSCRTLVCVTQERDEDETFWDDKTKAFYFITMVRINKTASVEDKWSEIQSKMPKEGNYIKYLSYDHSEIIVVTKTNTYSEGVRNMKLIRKICEAVKTYTIFAVKEDVLQSYNAIQSKVTEENVCCRLHCMVKEYGKAEEFKKSLERHLAQRNGKTITIRKYETFGGYDWLLEIDDVSVSSIFECYRMGEMLTHSNKEYREAFFNVESEIFTTEG